MKIGIDIDETVIKFLKPFLKYWNEKYFTDYKYKDFKNYDLDLTLSGGKDKIVKELIYFLDNTYPLKYKTYFASIPVIRKLKKDGHEIIFITSRPTISYIKLFFKLFKIPYDGLVVAKDKEMVYLNKNIDIVIDDCPSHIEAATMHDIKTIIFGKPWNKHCHTDKNTIRTKSWIRIYNIINRWKNE